MLHSPLTIAPGQSVDFIVKLDRPFVNTATNPAAGQRVFQIENIYYSTNGSAFQRVASDLRSIV
jgi:hypothetical protein